MTRFRNFIASGLMIAVLGVLYLTLRSRQSPLAHDGLTDFHAYWHGRSQWTVACCLGVITAALVLVADARRLKTPLRVTSAALGLVSVGLWLTQAGQRQTQIASVVIANMPAAPHHGFLHTVFGGDDDWHYLVFARVVLALLIAIAVVAVLDVVVAWNGRHQSVAG